jgi:hypothetical protein
VSYPTSLLLSVICALQRRCLLRQRPPTLIGPKHLHASSMSTGGDFVLDSEQDARPTIVQPTDTDLQGTPDTSRTVPEGMVAFGSLPPTKLVFDTDRTRSEVRSAQRTPVSELLSGEADYRMRFAYPVDQKGTADRVTDGYGAAPWPHSNWPRTLGPIHPFRCTGPNGYGARRVRGQ